MEDNHNLTFGLYSENKASNDTNFIIDTPQTSTILKILIDLLQILQISQIAISVILFIVLFAKRVPYMMDIAHYKISLQSVEGWKKVKVNLFKIYIYSNQILLDGTFLYYLIYLCIAFLGLFNPVFSALLLFDLFRRFPILLSILQSLWRPRWQIILTLLLLFLLNYYFSLIYYYNFY